VGGRVNLYIVLGVAISQHEQHIHEITLPALYVFNYCIKGKRKVVSVLN
jgi:hypothetical protein